MKIRTWLLLILFFLPLVGVQAQEREQFGAFGLGISTADTRSIMGWGALGIPISDRLISYTDMDVSVVKGTLEQMLQKEAIQYKIRTGAAVLVSRPFKWMSLWALGDAGMAAGGLEGFTGQTVVKSSFAGGGFAHFKISDAVGILAIWQVETDQDTSAKIPRIGVQLKLK